MHPQLYFKSFIHFMLLLAAINFIEGRGGGRRGGSLFSWRKVKKTSSPLSARRQNSGSYLSGSLGSYIGYKPLKITQKKPQMPSYPRQQLPIGATYYASGTSLPQGAIYHAHSYYGSGVAIPPGGMFYANAAALPSNAVVYAVPSKPTFSSENFLFGFYAGHIFGQSLFGPHQHAVPISGDKGKDKSNVFIVNNGTADSAAEIITDDFTVINKSFESFNRTIFSPSLKEGGRKDEYNFNSVKNATIANQTSTEYGIVCFPLMINETNIRNDEDEKTVQQMVCYPAPPPLQWNSSNLIPQSEASYGVICMPRKDIETKLTLEVTPKIDCYPAPAPSKGMEDYPPTKSPESVIGNLPTDEEVITEQEESAVARLTVLRDFQDEKKRQWES